MQDTGIEKPDYIQLTIWKSKDWLVHYYKCSLFIAIIYMEFDRKKKKKKNVFETKF